MCGIIGILSRPSRPRGARAQRSCSASSTRRSPPTALAAAAAAVRRCDELLKGVPGVRALDRSVRTGGRHHRPTRPARSARRRDRERASSPTRRSIPTSRSGSPTELIELRDATWAVRNDRLRTAREVEALAGRDSTHRPRSPATSRSSSRCRRSIGSRCAAATPPACTCSCGTTGCRCRTRWSCDCSPSATTIRCSRTARCASPASASASSTRRPQRSASSATTPAPCAPRSRADELLRLALSQPDARLDRARSHPLGQRRNHQRGQLPSAQQRGARADRRRSVHGRRAQRRCRQPRRHQGRSRPAHRRRRSPPTPRSSPP